MSKTKKKVGPYRVKAWALVNNQTGRLMLTNVAPWGASFRRMEQPEVYMTKAAAKYHANADELVVPITITCRQP